MIDVEIPVEGFPRQACPNCGNPFPKTSFEDRFNQVLCCMVKYDMAHHPIEDKWVWREIASYARPR
jgi:hypothetical protein